MIHSRTGQACIHYSGNKQVYGYLGWSREITQTEDFVLFEVPYFYLLYYVFNNLEDTSLNLILVTS